jgi:hypothetical protein
LAVSRFRAFLSPAAGNASRWAFNPNNLTTYTDLSGEQMKKTIKSVLITIALVIAACIFIAVVPSEIINTIMDNPLIFFGGLILAVIIFLAVLAWIGTPSKVKAEKSRPNFFEEMQSVLGSTLLPLSFKEKGEQNGWIKKVEYSRDEFVVSFSTHIADQEYSISASSKSEIKDGQKSPIHDFLVYGVLSKPDEFKSEAIAKLNEWLIEKNK